MHEHQDERGIYFTVSIIISGALLVLALAVLPDSYKLFVCIAAYLLVGWPVLKEAVEHILHGQVFDENFLMTIASLGAFAIGESAEAVAVMLLYQVGEFLQDKAVDSSRDSIKALLAIRPDIAHLKNGEKIAAKDAEVGTVIIVRPGERIPLDGIIRGGCAAVDTSPLTGEALPRQWTAGDTALAGCICTDGTLTIEVTKPYSQSSISRIMTLVENAQEKKAQPEQFITRFAKVYTPAVCGIALLVAFLPPLLGFGPWHMFLHKALAFLVISCPCALVISVPLSFFSGIGCAGHHGILCKGGNYLELLSKAKIAAFDKTGTLTRGQFSVEEIAPAEGVAQEKLLEVAAYCESSSTHPLAKAIVAAYGNTFDGERISNVKELAGNGITAQFDGKIATVGKRSMLESVNAPLEIPDATTVFVSYDRKYLGYITLSDTVKADSVLAIRELKKMGLHDLTMLSGDRQTTTEKIAQETGISNAYGELLPEDKVAKIKELQKGGITIFAGDGINDAPVLATADVGIAMGGLGSDTAMEAADVVIMTDEPAKIAQAIQISRKTMKIAKENIAFSIGVKVLILMLSLIRSIGLWIAVFADVGVCLLAILNSLRALRVKGA